MFQWNSNDDHGHDEHYEQKHVFLSLAEHDEPVFRSIGFTEGLGNSAEHDNHRSLGFVDDAGLDAPSLSSWSAAHSVKPTSIAEHLDAVAPHVAALSADAFDLALEPQPAYYEVFSSLFSLATPAVLMMALASAMAGCGCEAEQPDPHRAKFKGVLYPQGVAFRVELFTSADGRILVEVQRRSGCVVAFANMFRSIRAALLEQRLIIDANGKTTSTSPSVRAVPLQSETRAELDADALSRLIEMAASVCVDVQREALSALLSFASQPASKKLLQRDERLAKIVTAAEHGATDEIVRGCASRILAAIEKSANPVQQPAEGRVAAKAGVPASMYGVADQPKQLAPQLKLAPAMATGSILRSGSGSNGVLFDSVAHVSKASKPAHATSSSAPSFIPSHHGAL